MTSSLHIVFVVYEYLPQASSPKDFLAAIPTLEGWCTALVEVGCKVSVVCRFSEQAQLRIEEVDYFFYKDRYGPGLRPWQLPYDLHTAVRDLAPDLVHTHNLNKVLPHWHLARRLGPSVPVLVQNHAEWPAKRLRILLQRWLFRRLSAFLFCVPEQAKAWQTAGVIRPTHRLAFVMEGSTYFGLQSRTTSRTKTGLKGEPILLWVGHLNENKDPLTILYAFAQLLRKMPKARLYLIYRDTDLLANIRELLTTDTTLASAVELLGAKPHAELADYYNSADYFVLGSAREGSGYALMEALACGCVPIVSDIPTFRMMTNDGKLGGLFKVGELIDCTEVMQHAINQQNVNKPDVIRAFFDDKLSYPAIARQMLSVYQDLIRSARDTD